LLKENNTKITQTIEQKTSISERLRQQKISNYDFLFDFKYFELKLGLVKKNKKEIKPQRATSLNPNIIHGKVIRHLSAPHVADWRRKFKKCIFVSESSCGLQKNILNMMGGSRLASAQTNFESK